MNPYCIKTVAIFILVGIVLSGCSSARLTTSLKKQDFNNNEGIKLNIRKVHLIYDGLGGEFAQGNMRSMMTPDLLMASAQNHYPELFDPNEDSLPVDLSIKIKYSSSVFATLFLEFGTLTAIGSILPAPIFNKTNLDLNVSVQDEYSKNLVQDSVTIEQKSAVWLTILTPLALIPIPGKSDIPKISEVGGNAKYAKAIQKTLKEAILNGIVKAIKSGDMREMVAAYSFRKQLHEKQKRATQEILAGNKVEPFIKPLVQPTTITGLSSLPELPKTSTINRDAVAIVIGNRNYSGHNSDVPDVDFAHNDADVMAKYLRETLGFREGNILVIKDATQAALMGTFGTKENFKGRLFNWVRPDRSDVFVYYSGHGAPSISDGRGYLLPVNANPDTVELNGYSLDTLYRNLGKIPARSITVAIDACFSGSSQAGSVIKSASAISLKRVEPKIATPNTTIFTAAGLSEVASWDKEAQLGLFTKQFMEGVIGKADKDGFGNGDGQVTLGELRSYLESEVTYMARRLYNRDQHPQINGMTEKVFSFAN